MDQQDNKDFARQWDDLLKDTFGGTEISVDTDAEEEPTAITPAPETPAKRPLYRCFWFWLILIVLAAGLGIAAWFFCEKGADTEPTTPLDAHTQKVLEQCKAGLAQWQAMDSYYVTKSTLFYGDNMNSVPRGKFLRSGEDFMQITYWSAGLVSGIIKHDGITYSARAYIDPTTGVLDKNYWATLEENVATEFLTPWPMSFNWDASEIVNIIATGNAAATADETHYTFVSFSVLRSDSADPFMYPCDVNFTFDVYGNLESVTVVEVEPGEAERTSITVITYRLETTDQDIAQFIEEAPSQPLTFVLSNSPAPLPE